MPSEYIQVEFLIPNCRDVELSDGIEHPADAWSWLDDRLWDAFFGRTKAPGLYQGFYRDLDTGTRVDDESHKFIVALPEVELPKLRRLLEDACWIFQQKCIYLNVGGRVEFVELPRLKDHENSEQDLP